MATPTPDLTPKPRQILNQDTQPGVDIVGQMNPNLSNAVNSQITTGGMTPEQIVARQMSGVDKSASVPTQQTLMQRGAGLGGDQDAGMQAAIANRASKAYGTQLNRIGQAAKMSAPLTQFQQEGAALKGMSEQELLTDQMANAQAVKAQNDEAKRNATLDAVLSLGGTIVGGIGGALIGGPAGAVAGAQAGAALGGGLGKGAAGLIEGSGAGRRVQSLDTRGDYSNYFGGK